MRVNECYLTSSYIFDVRLKSSYILIGKNYNNLYFLRQPIYCRYREKVSLINTVHRLIVLIDVSGYIFI